MKEVKVCLMCNDIYETKIKEEKELNLCPTCTQNIDSEKMQQVIGTFDKLHTKNNISNQYLTIAMSYFLLGMSMQQKNNWEGLTSTEEELFFRYGSDKLKDTFPKEYEHLEKLIEETKKEF